MRVAVIVSLLAAGCAFGGETNPREGDAGASARDSGSVPQIDASFVARDAGGGSDAEIPPPVLDAGSDAGSDAGTDAGLCDTLETCDGVDEDCDGAIDEGAACPCPVVNRAGHAYLFCDVDRSWLAARMSCEASGYSLAVIEDAAEDVFVYGELAARGFDDTWVGLNDVLTEMSWVWLDGIPLVYAHWDDGEPNDGGDGGEDCGVIMTRSGRESEWDDRECDSERPYVCEAPTAP